MRSEFKASKEVERGGGEKGGSKKRKVKLPCRDYLLDFLEENNCVMNEKELLDKLASIYKKFGVSQEEAHDRAYTCLKNAVRAGAVKRFTGKVINLRCRHERDVVKGLRILLYTLDILESRRSSRLEEYKEKLYQMFNIISLKEAERLMKIALEHLITSEECQVRAVRLLETKVIVSQNEGRVMIDPEVLNELKDLVVEMLPEVESWKSIGGCCRECIKTNLCGKCSITDEYAKIVEAVVSVMLENVSRFEFI
jgi:chaperonin cofactor prefoldin